MRLLCVLALLTGPALLWAADQAAPEAAPAHPVIPVREQNREWVAALTRLRQEPRPGEIEHGSVYIEVARLYALDAEQKSKVEDELKAYDAAVLQKAALWEKELDATRAEYEAKLLTHVPEARREAAAKVLAFSHAHWLSSEDRDVQLTHELAEKMAKLKGLTGEELKDARAAIPAWLRARKQEFTAEARAILDQLHALLTPDETARLDATDRSRVLKH